MRDFILELEQLVSVISEENKIVFLMGDWNLNFMNHSFHQATGEFLDLLFSRMFFSFDYSISSLFRILNDIADHLPIFAVLSGCEQIFHRNKYFTFRSKNQQH